jgi:hypothetical protein
MDERQATAAARVLDYIAQQDRDYSKTPEQEATDIYNQISIDPVSVINYLLGVLDDLTA